MMKGDEGESVKQGLRQSARIKETGRLLGRV